MGNGGEGVALQVIVLGSGGGPLENNTTAFLVRSLAQGWKKGSVLAVDAGVHLAAITNILDGHKADFTDDGIELPITLINGPFAGLEINHRTATANAAHVTRHLIDTYLITHPHLDHICGFVVNTAALPSLDRPKRLAGLPKTIEAFKNHIFNNIIWPNLSDEGLGAGLVTYMRLVDGGSPALGDGDGKGYVEVCEGLSVKTWSVSHGHCIENHPHRGSHVDLDSPSLPASPHTPQRLRRRTNSLQLPLSPLRESSLSSQVDLLRSGEQGSVCVCDSSAYFIRDIATGAEVLIFGDVEPDSISLSPRNKIVWSEAAPKIASGALTGIFIECSYDDSQTDDRLFGHLAPRFLIEELKILAMEVEMACMGPGNDRDTRKRKRLSNGADYFRRLPTRTSTSNPRKPTSTPTIEEELSPLSQPQPQTRKRKADLLIELTEADGAAEDYEDEPALPVRTRREMPLQGLRVVIIHVKERLTDGPHIGETILEQLLAYEKEAQLGCEFVISRVGQAVYL